MRYIFPQMNNEAEYNYLSHVISLNNISKENLEYIINTPLDIENIKHFNVLAHEITHYIDHIATLKGQELITSASEALYVIQNGIESEMWRVIKFNKFHKSIFHDSVYKIIDKKISNSNIDRWSFIPTVGLRFNRRGIMDSTIPIMFTRFYFDNERVARIPLSLESIWESNAMATELNFLTNEMVKIYENGDKISFEIYMREHERKINEYIYNSELLVYSNTAHYIAKYICNDTDLFTAYDGMRVISGICSNLPDTYFNQLRIPSELKSIIGDQRLRNLIKNKDIGLLFYSLVINYKNNSPNVGDKIYSIADSKFGHELLRCSGLPNKEEIEHEVINEMDKNIIKIKTINFEPDFMTYQLELGKKTFLKRGIFNEKIYDIILRTKISDFPIITSDEITSVECLRAYKFSALEDKIVEFSTACTY